MVAAIKTISLNPAFSSPSSLSLSQSELFPRWSKVLFPLVQFANITTDGDLGVNDVLARGFPEMCRHDIASLDLQSAF